MNIKYFPYQIPAGLLAPVKYEILLGGKEDISPLPSSGMILRDYESHGQFFIWDKEGNFVQKINMDQFINWIEFLTHKMDLRYIELTYPCKKKNDGRSEN